MTEEGSSRVRKRRRTRRGLGRRRMLNVVTSGLLGIENKYLDTYGTGIAIPAPADCTGGEMQPTGGCTDCLSAPATGDGATNRDGKKIVITSLFMTGEIGYGLSGDRADVIIAPTVFLALVLDTQTNGATIVSEQVFTNPNSNAATNGFPLRNMSNTTRYKVLKHKTIRPSITVTATDGANTCSNDANSRSFILSWRGTLPVSFGTGTTADVANVVDNSLHLIAFATGTSTDTLAASINYNCRIRFQG